MNESPSDIGEPDAPLSVDSGITAKLIHDVVISLYAVLGSAYTLKRMADLGIVNAMQDPDIQAIAFMSCLSLAVLFMRYAKRRKGKQQELDRIFTDDSPPHFLP